jgi:hypothetical protein
MPSGVHRPRLIRKEVVWIFLFCCIVFGYLYAALFDFSGVPFFRTGDEEFFWEYAYRMLSGQVFLRDFYQFTPPGVDILYETFFHFFGLSIASTSWAILLLGLALTLVCFLIAKRIMPLDFALLSALACLVLLYGDRLDATHHWFSSLAALLAILVLFPNRSLINVVVSGMFIALSAFCTQTAGAMTLVACSASLLWERRFEGVSWQLTLCRLAFIFVSAMLGWALLSWRFIVEAGWKSYWFSQVVYPQRYVRSQAGFLFPPFGHPSHLHSWISFADHVLVYLVILFVCPWVAWLCMRRHSLAAHRLMHLVLLSSLGVCLTLEVITRLDWNRMDAVAIPGVILCIWAVSRAQKFKPILMAMCWCLVGWMALTQSLAIGIHHYRRLSLPTGPALFQQDEATEFEWIMQHTRPGDSFFGVATMSYYTPLQLKNPSPVDVLLPYRVTLPEWVTLTISRLEQTQVEYILWSPKTGILHVEDSPSSEEDHLGPFRYYLKSHFMLIKTFANGDEIWKRVAKAKVDPANWMPILSKPKVPAVYKQYRIWGSPILRANCLDSTRCGDW